MFGNGIRRAGICFCQGSTAATVPGPRHFDSRIHRECRDGCFEFQSLGFIGRHRGRRYMASTFDDGPSAGSIRPVDMFLPHTLDPFPQLGGLRVTSDRYRVRPATR